MPKSNIKGGKKHKRIKKGVPQSASNFQLANKEENQLYGVVVKKLGTKYLEVKCSDGVVRRAFIRGALQKKVWMSPDDVLLLSLRDFTSDDEKCCDIISKYTTDQVRQLLSNGEINSHLVKIESIGSDDEEEVVFGDDADDVGDVMFSKDALKTTRDIASKARYVDRNANRDSKQLGISSKPDTINSNSDESPLNIDDI